MSDFRPLWGGSTGLGNIPKKTIFLVLPLKKPCCLASKPQVRRASYPKGINLRPKLSCFGVFRPR